MDGISEEILGAQTIDSPSNSPHQIDANGNADVVGGQEHEWMCPSIEWMKTD